MTNRKVCFFITYTTRLFLYIKLPRYRKNTGLGEAMRLVCNA